MPDKPTVFRSRPLAARKGGSPTKRDRSAAYQRTRAGLLDREPLCRYCFNSTPPRITAATVVDHVVALALGGSNLPGNLAPACRDCNDRKAGDELRFLAKGYDACDLGRDPNMAGWLKLAAIGG